MKIYELRKLVDGMTPGPWRAGRHDEVEGDPDHDEGPTTILTVHYEATAQDPSAVVALRNHADTLISFVEAVASLPTLKKRAARIRGTADLADDDDILEIEEAERAVRRMEARVLQLLAALEAIP